VLLYKQLSSQKIPEKRVKEILVNKIKFKEIYITTPSFYGNGENIFGVIFWGKMILKYGFLSTCCNIRLLTRIIHSSY